MDAASQLLFLGVRQPSSPVKLTPQSTLSGKKFSAHLLRDLSSQLLWNNAGRSQIANECI